MIEVVFEFNAKQQCHTHGKQYAAKEISIELYHEHRHAKPCINTVVYAGLRIECGCRNTGPVRNQKLQKQTTENLQKAPLNIFFIEPMSLGQLRCPF